MADEQNIKTQDTHQEYYNNSRLTKSVLQITWVHTWLMVIAIGGSTVWFTSNTLGRISKTEEEIIKLKSADRELMDADKSQAKDSDKTRVRLLENVILVKQNLVDFMKSKGYEWNNKLPDNFNDLVK